LTTQKQSLNLPETKVESNCGADKHINKKLRTCRENKQVRLLHLPASKNLSGSRARSFSKKSCIFIPRDDKPNQHWLLLMRYGVHFMSKCWLILLLLFSARVYAQDSKTVPVVANGFIDLSAANLNKQPVPLNGNWYFHWNQLLTGHAAFAPQSPLAPLPGNWTKLQQNGKALPSKGYATYALTIKLPPALPAMALLISGPDCSYRLYAGDSLVGSDGIVSASPQDAAPHYSTKLIELPPLKDSLQLVLQIANYWHIKGGYYKPVLLGTKVQLQKEHNTQIAVDLILAGCLLMGGLFFLGFYFFGRRNSSILFFALFCLVYCYRVVGSDGYVLHGLFPALPFQLTTRLEYLSLVTGVMCFVLYTHCLYPKEANRLLIRVMIAICCLYGVIILFTPVIFFTQLINFYLTTLYVFIGCGFYIFYRAFANRRPGSFFALISTFVVLFVFLVTILQYFNYLPPLRALVLAAYIVFFFLQAQVLAHQFAYELRVAVKQAQQGLKVKTEFLSTMSHEIRTPLNSVIGMAHILSGSKPRPDQAEHLNVLQYSANHLLSLLNNILDFNKIEEEKISFEQAPMDLPMICSNIMSGFRNTAQEKGIELRMSVDDKIRYKVLGDPVRTTQVLGNLVHNAVKFTAKGWVRLSIKAGIPQNGKLPVTFMVQDTGIGIPPEKLELIFDHFTQADSSVSRSYGGTGLGLSISKKILGLQGVALHVESKEDSGATFYFTQSFGITSEPLELVAYDTGEENHTQQLAGISILLVEDNPLNVRVAETLLRRYGAEVETAENGEVALNIFDATRHHLILMDLSMPVMDGYEAVRILRSRNVTTPVIALTAGLGAGSEQEMEGKGFNDVVIKPFNPADLIRVIRKYV
jgi:signal transduction histidine kinase/CheY-like chemotaxis protein